MWAFILSLFNPLAAITDKLAAAYLARQQALTDQERIASDERITTLEARKQIILQAQVDPMERWIRIGFALPFVLYNAKLIIWDKILEFGVTDPLSNELAIVQSVVIGGYFLDLTVKRITRR